MVPSLPFRFLVAIGVLFFFLRIALHLEQTVLILFQIHQDIVRDEPSNKVELRNSGFDRLAFHVDGEFCSSTENIKPGFSVRSEMAFVRAVYVDHRSIRFGEQEPMLFAVCRANPVNEPKGDVLVPARVERAFEHRPVQRVAEKMAERP
jgi:hypothetical protein